jgi:hypothetical protein
MTRPAFVFLHVGPDAVMPSLLVRSLRAQHAEAEIIQCTDALTQPVAGVDTVRRHAGDITNLMTFRLESFAALERNAPAVYLDTDMLCLRPLDAQDMLGTADIAVCSREFHRDALFNPRFGNLDLGEYEGRTLAEVYPYVACTTAAPSSAFWVDCRDNLRTLHPKFHRWYGDQEAIRNVASSGKYGIGRLPESVYGCLPDEPSPAESPAPPRLLHFKGAARKGLMLDVARRLRLH